MVLETQNPEASRTKKRVPPVLLCLNGWLTRHLLSRRLHLASRVAISRSLDAWLHHRCPFRNAVAPSIAVAVALPSCRPSPPSLVDCCRFHRHRRVNVHSTLLPSRSLCCACHRRPSLSRHPSPPLLVECCIFMSIAASPSITNAPSRRPSPSTLLLLRCRRAVPVHCRRH